MSSPRKSPYDGIPSSAWRKRTLELIAAHPLAPKEIVEVVLSSWKAIFQSSIGPRNFKIGKDIFPKPQILGFFLHELIPLELQSRYPKVWRIEETASDKDLVCLTNVEFSVEIKTSSSAANIYGNRSYAEITETGKKDKAGYYLAINFEKCDKTKPNPCVKVIRFGWLDHSDWMGQAAASGQQARLSPEVETNKLLKLYSSTEGSLELFPPRDASRKT